MQFVSAIHANGHEELTLEQLAALVDVANRSGFSVVGIERNESEPVYRIKFHAPMKNPYFIANLEDRRVSQVRQDADLHG